MRVRTSAVGLALKLGTLVALLPAAGCYTYAGTTLESASLGTQARLRLDDDGFGRVVNQAAMSGFPVESLDVNRKGVVGRIVAIGSDDLSVEMRGIGGSVFRAEVPTGAIQELAVRSFSRKRTILTIAGGLALAGTLGSGAFGGTTTQGGPVPPDNMLMMFMPIPLVSIPFP